MNQNAENKAEQEWVCPNCLEKAVKIGNEVTCEKCDASFRITKQQTKLKDIRISRRLNLLEEKVFGSEEPPPETPPEPAPETPPEPEPKLGPDGEPISDEPTSDEDD